MFAKLKKKIIEENGGGTDGGERLSAATPSNHSPARRSSGTPAIHGAAVQGALASNSPTAKDPSIGSSSPVQILVPSSEISGREGSVTWDELTAQLAKRTEQCKKMEGNISDLAALIKDKNRIIERLEAQISQHQAVLMQKLAEQKSDFEAYRDKLIAGYQQDKLALEKERQELNKQLKEAQEYKDKYLKREADVDEVQDLATQELAKVKHMLLIKQDELEECQTKLSNKTRDMETEEALRKRLEKELTQTSEKAVYLEAECERLKEDNKERAELVTSLTKEKSVFDRRLDQLNNELTEKHKQMADLNRQLYELDSKHRALEHSSEQHRNKMIQETSKLLEEKEDHIETLRDRVATLEQRLRDHDLSGDEQLTALQNERDGLEKKLGEAKQQLMEIKSTWSDKISHLEAQISHLNSKIVEDNEELASSQRATDTMRDNFQRQIEELRSRLEDAEKRALENFELVSSNETHYERQIHDLEGQLTCARLTAVEAETHLRGKITSLEMQLTDLETARQTEQNESRHKIEKLEEQYAEAVTRELKHEQSLRASESLADRFQKELVDKQEEIKKLQQDLENKCQSDMGKGQKVVELELQVQQLQTQVDKGNTELSTVRRRLSLNEQEKGELMVRNAQLSQQLTSQQHQHTQQMQELQQALQDQEQIIRKQEATVQELNTSLAALQHQVEELKCSQVKSETTEELHKVILDLQDQLADKTRTLKKQEQTVKDLRQTLQRELKIQTLPNDDASDDSTIPSPAMVRKLYPQKGTGISNASASNMGFSTGSQFSSASSPSSAATLSLSSSTTAAVKPMTVSSVTQISDTRGMVVRRDLEQDINFQYLKHVVLKFMLSRESEAVQLIKAVAVLLNFSNQEQQLIKQNLEWKMSWFGSRPSMGKGQMAKMVPPSY
ncbi:golgin subfamily A member 1-like isoform X1 [Pomacea canaliculata]|uniref:golgin subfamily A member 1-like isoform X1 n=1 Tax=Pomacea canaliculata TaxID=400727 RepID=UPI000D731BC7|nr:golgin subfamily A member 1-like isoform X1 [Pomacea canaliculata]